MQFPVGRQSSFGGPPASNSTNAAAAPSTLNARKAMPVASNFSFATVGLSPAQANASWALLAAAIGEIHSGNQGRLSFEQLYRNAYMLVLHKHGDMLYRGVDDMVTKRMEEVARQVRQASDAYLLDSLVSAWEDHQLKQSLLRDILLYMNKTYCKAHSLPLVYERGMARFRDLVLLDRAVQLRLRNIMLDMVRRERESEIIDGVLLRHACAMLVEVNLAALPAAAAANSTEHPLYARLFEEPLLAQTQAFYAAESQRLVVSTSVPDYLRAVEARLAAEEGRADRYFDPSTKPKLRAILQEELLVRYASRLVADQSSGAGHMLAAGDVDNLGRMYALFCREPEKTLPPLREALSSLVKAQGAAIVSAEKSSPSSFVERLLQLRSHFLRLVSLSFRDDRSFAHALKDALEHTVNIDSLRAAQYLSAYTDDTMRKQQGHASGGLSDKDLNTKLDDVLSLFRYLSDKDVFEEYYKQHLALRLLEFANQGGLASGGGVGASSGAGSGEAAKELEKIMIAKLKAECGHQFTSKLEGMFRDNLSRELMHTWREGEAHAAAAAGVSTLVPAAPSCELSVAVLTTGFWPLPSVPACRLPPEAQALTERFRSFYLGQHSGRKLSWLTSLGSAELRANFDSGRRELVVHTYAMVILCLFNDPANDKLSFADIHRLTGIPLPELQQHLLSLAHPAVKVLLKNPPGKAMAPDHRFKVNMKYTSNMYRNRVPVLSKQAAGVGGPDAAAGEGAAAAAAGSGAAGSSGVSVPASVLESRQFSTEAALVRILKSRKRLEHSQLVGEVMRQLGAKFPVEPAFIKKRIEALIERDYMERDPDNRRIYIYKA